MKNLAFKSALLAALTLPLAFAPVAQAQPDPNNAPKADNPENRPARPNRAERDRMTPEQREAQRKEQMQRYFKGQMTKFGLTDETQQTAVISYIEGEAEARGALLESGRDLAKVMGNEAVTDTQVAALLNKYHAAIEDDKTRREASEKKLNQSVPLLKFPRLEAFLTVMGFYGDGTGFGGAMGGNWMRGNNRNR